MQPLFVIAPPRSYTSVVGGMLGSHRQAYGLPEVNLSGADTLGDLWDAVPMPGNHATSGLLRLLAELHDGEQTEAAVLRARQWVLRRPHWGVARVFAHVQEAVGEGRLLVDKSPRNAMRIENLRRLHATFPQASFLHLTRHPQTQGRSFLELVRSYGDESEEIDPERNWLRAHAAIVEFSRDLAPGQLMRIKGEALLGDPEAYLPQICEWLGIDGGEDALEAMLHPEASPFARIGPPSAPFGNDPNFLTGPRLDFERLLRIAEPPMEDEVAWKPGQGFSEPVSRLARRFGYA